MNYYPAGCTDADLDAEFGEEAPLSERERAEMSRYDSGDDGDE